MCEKLPQTEAEMLNVSGVGQNKLQKYGQRFLQEIAVFLTANTRYRNLKEAVMRYSLTTAPL